MENIWFKHVLLIHLVIYREIMEMKHIKNMFFNHFNPKKFI
jgi:hypothetical protein